MTETERMYAYFICSIPMIGGVRAGQLLSRFGDPQGVYEAGTAGWREILNDSVVEYMDRQKKSGNLEEEYHSLGEKQIGLVMQDEVGLFGLQMTIRSILSFKWEIPRITSERRPHRSHRTYGCLPFPPWYGPDRTGS